MSHAKAIIKGSDYGLLQNNDGMKVGDVLKSVDNIKNISEFKKKFIVLQERDIRTLTALRNPKKLATKMGIT